MQHIRDEILKKELEEDKIKVRTAMMMQEMRDAASEPDYMRCKPERFDLLDHPLLIVFSVMGVSITVFSMFS